MSVEERTLRTPETPVEIRTFSKDQLILPKEPSPKALRLLKRAEEIGWGGLFAVHSLSAVRLTKDTRVPGWNKKPSDWYWEQIKKGTISKDAAQLPDVEILIDKTPRPNYKNGKQLHEYDPLGPFMARLRKEKRISLSKDIPETSRFWTPPEPDLTEVVFPEMLSLLGEDASAVRLPTETEFNILGNFSYPYFGEADTSEWLNDKFEGGNHLIGGGSGDGGLAGVYRYWSGNRNGYVTFRPLVVISP